MNPEHEIVRMKFGSQVYGTSLPSSDTDLKAVYLPAGRDLLLGRVPKRSISSSTGDSEGKNTSEDVDLERYTLKGFLDLLCDGQTVATDMLFVPSTQWEHLEITWAELRANQSKFLSRNVKGFLGYCRTQAAKYGIKGSRVAAARDARDMFAGFPNQAKVKEFENEIIEFAYTTEHAHIVSIDQPGDRPALLHLEVCGKKVPWTTSIREAHKVYNRLFEQYGQRALDAENNENIDWKAIMHAVRIGQQAIELLETGFITFPRPNAKSLLQIRQGMVQYQSVAEELEELLEQVESASTTSPLRAEPDREFAESFILAQYEGQI